MKKIITIIITFAILCSISGIAAQASEESKEVKYKNGYPVLEIESELHYNGSYRSDIKELAKKHPYEEYQGYILFYGASNFRLWKTMEEDMAEYKVINHGFGGSTDVDMVHYANTAAFPYEPAIIVFQTGSNDYGGLEGTDAEKVEKCMAFKVQMFSGFHEILPDAKFLIMSGLLNPGRSELLELTQEINARLEALAEETDYIYFADASDMTWDGTSFREDLFIEDGIHLTHEGQMLWLENYIRPMLEQIITENGLESVRK